MGTRWQYALVGALCAWLAGAALNSRRRVHTAPENARVSVYEGEMVPLPYADHWLTGGQAMTLREARAAGVQPVDDAEIDWTYTTSGFCWLLATPRSSWTVAWPERDYDPDRWP